MRLIDVVVTFNRLEKLKETISRSLKEPFDTIIVVNNASTDGTEEWLSSLDEDKVVVVNSVRNVGGAGGFNLGLAEALKHNPSWICMHDDDSYPEVGCIEQFRTISIDIEPTVDAVSAAVYLPTGVIAEMNRPFLNPFLRRTAAGSRGKSRVSDEMYIVGGEVDAVTFVGFFVRADSVRSYLGLPDPELFIYADDMIYTYQIKKAGRRILFRPELAFVHDCETLQGNSDVYLPEWKVYYTYRNRILFYKTLIDKKWLYLVVLVQRVCLWAVASVNYPRRRIYFKYFMHAVIDGVRSNTSRGFAEIKGGFFGGQK
ncbi:glycosyltransferase [Granulosicoccaceae sp. 1_MG-2023]|nr:glycosyltransferase [Granulosicoccaceae sp. 1_MG-2023]